MILSARSYSIWLSWPSWASYKLFLPRSSIRQRDFVECRLDLVIEISQISLKNVNKTESNIILLKMRWFVSTTFFWNFSQKCYNTQCPIITRTYGFWKNKHCDNNVDIKQENISPKFQKKRSLLCISILSLHTV